MAFTQLSDIALAMATTAQLFEHFGGSPTKVGRIFGKTPSEAIIWRKRGYVSKPAAKRAGELILTGHLPPMFTTQALRPDVK